MRYYIELARHGAESGESGVDLAEQRLAAAQSMLAAASDDLHRAAVAQKRVDDADTALAKAKGPSSRKIHVSFYAARTLNATGQFRVTLSLR